MNVATFSLPCGRTKYNLRRNPDLKWRQTEQSLSELVIKQAAILKAASSLCKIGGYLVYATCSLLDEENEGVVEEFLTQHKNFSILHPNFVFEKRGIKLDFKNYLKLYPSQHGTDGFFGALLMRVE